MKNNTKPSLIQKLGIKPAFFVTFINYPAGYEKTLGSFPEGVVIGLIDEGPFDFIQIFTKKQQELQTFFPILKNHIKKNGMIWISWPKLTSGIESDLSKKTVREIGFQNGMVDVKVVSIDKDWAGLKFIIRLEDKI